MTGVRLPHGAVVVGVDGSAPAGQALDWAIQHTARTHAPIVVVHAIGTGSTAQGQGILDQAAARVTARLPQAAARTVLLALDPREALLELHEAALIVIGSRGRGRIRSLVLGSVSAAVSRHARCPVVVVRPHRRGVVRRGVLVGADGSAHSVPALEFAYQYASMHDLPLTAMHTPWQAGPEEGRLLLSESVSGLGAKYPDVYATLQIAQGLPDRCLVRAGERMHLIVVGRRAPREQSRLGVTDVTVSVVEHARCAVAVVPDTGSRGLVTIVPRGHDERL